MQHESVSMWQLCARDTFKWYKTYINMGGGGANATHNLFV